MLQRFKKDYPKFKDLFTFQEFNDVQIQCYTKIFNYNDNMVVSAPTSSGKTVLFELLIAKMMNQGKTKCLYLAPIKSLCYEKTQSWKKKFIASMHIMQLTGDTLQMQLEQFNNADIYIATPEKIDYISRKHLGFLKELNLLLIDEIHMLNMEERGAILQVIVSRIMSINKNIRIMAVSATIPNVEELAQWLKVPKPLICVFGPQYRPAKLHKIVLGFNPANNDFNFEKILNSRVYQAISKYSHDGASLIFCQTQKGTEEACNRIISDAPPGRFIGSSSIQISLREQSRNFDNALLKSFILKGVAFHNASLSMKDRSTVEKLFLESKIKVLCTTSTLAMGVNLPARLVIIKSTKCYKGAGKGYQQYSQIQLDQMMGRAGRVPFDKEGTVVIMTQKGNYNKYMSDFKLQSLESQLYSQFIDHLNTEISLRSILNLNEAVKYFQNSFCYIRMLNSPKLYNLKGKEEVPNFIKETCLNSIKKLAQYDIIQYVESNQKIVPKQCSNNISRNAVEVQTITRIIDAMYGITTQRQFIQLLCGANQFSKYRSKLDERKFLKDLNQKNKYTLKQSISNAQKKMFVLIQSQLSGTHIENWELRKQASESVFFFKRLVYCVKCVAFEKRFAGKTFWSYYFGCLYHKYFGAGFWQSDDEKVLKQINVVASKWKNIKERGIHSLKELIQGVSKLDVFGSNMSSVALKKGIQDQLNLLNFSLQIRLKKVEQNQQNTTNAINDEVSHLLTFLFTNNFTEKLKSINVIVELSGTVYHSDVLSPTSQSQLSVYLKNSHFNKYFIAVLKDGYIGFDEYYWFEHGSLRKTQLKKEESNKKVAKRMSFDQLLKKQIQSQNVQDTQSAVKLKKNRANSSEGVVFNSKISQSKYNARQKSQSINSLPKKIVYIKEMPIEKKEDQLELFDQVEGYSEQEDRRKVNQKRQSDRQSIPNSNTLKIKRQKQQTLSQNFSTMKKKKDCGSLNTQNRQNKEISEMKQGKNIYTNDLKKYNWKPGFEKIKDIPDQSQFNCQNQPEASRIIEDKPNPKRILLLDEGQSNSSNQYRQKHGKNKQTGGVKAELNRFMKERYISTINKKEQGKFSQKPIFANSVILRKTKNLKTVKYIPEQQYQTKLTSPQNTLRISRQKFPSQQSSSSEEKKQTMTIPFKKGTKLGLSKTGRLSNISEQQTQVFGRYNPIQPIKDTREIYPSKISYDQRVSRGQDSSQINFNYPPPYNKIIEKKGEERQSKHPIHRDIAIPARGNTLQSRPTSKRFKNAHQYFESFFTDSESESTK